MQDFLSFIVSMTEITISKQMKTMKKNYLGIGLAAMSLLAIGCTKDYSDDANGMMALYSFDEMMSTIPEAGGDKFDDFTDNPFVKTTDEPVSTFSVDADGASYAIMRRYLTYGYNINPSSVRIEEFLNYFTFNYTTPKGDDHVWTDRTVEFFGETFRTIGNPTQGIDELIPLDWNKKVKVERYEQSED